MASTFTVDDLGKVASISYVDDKGDKVEDAGAVVSGWTSSDPAVASIDAVSGAITFLAVGSTDITATVTNADGTVLPVTADTLTVTGAKPVAGIVQIA